MEVVVVMELPQKQKPPKANMAHPKPPKPLKANMELLKPLKHPKLLKDNTVLLRPRLLRLPRLHTELL